MPNIYPLFINPVSSTYNPYWKNGLDSKMALMDPETVSLLTKEIPSNKYIKQIKSFQKMQNREKKKYMKDIKKNDKMKSKGQIKMFFNKAEEIINLRNEKKKEEEMAKKLEKQCIMEEQEKEKTDTEIEDDTLNKINTNDSLASSKELNKSQSSIIDKLNFNEEQYDIKSTSILNMINDKKNYDSNSYSDIEDTDSNSESETSEEEEVDDDDDDMGEGNMLYNEYLDDSDDNNKK